MDIRLFFYSLPLAALPLLGQATGRTREVLAVFFTEDPQKVEVVE